MHSCVHCSEVECDSLVDMVTISKQDGVPMNVKDRCIRVLAFLLVCFGALEGGHFFK